MKALCFYLGDQEYAMDITQVREVLDPPPITYIPHTPDFILGVINLRGSIIAIIDLRRFLDLAERPQVKGQKKIMILSVRNKTLGVLADRISQVRALDFTELDPPPTTLGQVPMELIKGVKQMGDHPLIFLDLGKILEAPQLRQLMG